jgi:glycosyltransferase involved in cell wall biosynthesis
MHIVIAGYFYFPTGMAASNRIKNLALGFINSGATVDIIAYKKTYYEQIELDEITYFEHLGIKIDFAIDSDKKRTKWEKAFLNSDASKTIVAKLQLLKEEKGIDMIFLYGDSYLLLNPIINFAKKNNIVTAIDIVEYRVKMFSALYYLSYPMALDILAGNLFLPGKVDLICTITTFLQKKYSKIKPTYLFPSIENWSNTEANARIVEGQPFKFLYIGTLIKRDAPDQLYAIVKALKNMKSNFKLLVVGRFEKNPEGIKWSKIFESQFNDNITLLGEISVKQLKDYVNQADGFILSRQDAITERFSFPTRLVEYLKEAKPVFAASVGDIPKYLTHMKEAILIDPEKPEGCIEDICNVINNREFAYEIGINGFNKGREVFNNITHSKNILQKMSDLKKSDV